MSTLAELLTDALNGVNNAAASTVSAPVDAISWGLRKAGLGNVIGSAPVGGSNWMRQKGLTRPTNGLAGDIGEFAGNVLPIAAAAKAPQIANGLLKMGENALAPTSVANLQRGAVDLNEMRPYVNPSFSANAPADAGYVYHVTGKDAFHDIQDSGKLNVFKPNYGTDQHAWPDGSLKKRAYFGKSPQAVEPFQNPDFGAPVLLRTKQTEAIKREGTGDFYTEKSLPATNLEFYGADGQWHPVK